MKTEDVVQAAEESFVKRFGVKAIFLGLIIVILLVATNSKLFLHSLRYSSGWVAGARTAAGNEIYFVDGSRLPGEERWTALPELFLVGCVADHLILASVKNNAERNGVEFESQLAAQIRGIINVLDRAGTNSVEPIQCIVTCENSVADSDYDRWAVVIVAPKNAGESFVEGFNRAILRHLRSDAKKEL